VSAVDDRASVVDDDETLVRGGGSDAPMTGGSGRKWAGMGCPAAANVERSAGMAAPGRMPAAMEAAVVDVVDVAGEIVDAGAATALAEVGATGETATAEAIRGSG